MSQRQQQKEQTAAHLRKTAYEVFCEKGILAARMSDIAQAAGVSHGTLFLHFKTQDTLIEEVVSYYGERLAQRTHELSRPCASLRDLLEAHLSAIGEMEPFYTRLVIESRMLPAPARAALLGVQSAVSLHFAQAAQRDLAARDVSPALLFNAWMGLVHYYLMNGDLFAPNESVIGRQKETLVNGFSALAGLKKTQWKEGCDE